MRRSVIVTNSTIAPYITRVSGLLTCCIAARLLYLCALFWRWRSSRVDRLDTSHWLSRHCRVHNVWLESDRRPFWFWPFSTSCYWNSYFNETVSDVLLVDIGDIHIGRTVVWRGVVEPDVYRGVPTVVRVCWSNETLALCPRCQTNVHRRSRRRHLHYRRRRWICRTAVAQRSADGICAAICNIALFPSFVRCGRPVSYP